MQRNRFLTLMLAACLGVVGIVAVVAYVNGANNRAIDRNDPVWVLTAREPIPAGTTGSTALKDRLLISVRYPRGSVPPDYVRHLSFHETSQVFTSALQPGTIIVSDLFGPRGQTASSLVVPGNDVALGLAVCQTQAVGGYIGPGSKVAVYNVAGKSQPIEASCSSHQPPSGGTVTTVVLPSVQVLAVQSAPSPGSAPLTTDGNSGSCASAGEGELCVVVAVPTAVSLKLADIAATGDLELLLLSDNSALPSQSDHYSSP